MAYRVVGGLARGEHKRLRLGLHLAGLRHVALGRLLVAIGWAAVGLRLPLIGNEWLATESRVVGLGWVLVDSLLLLEGLHELLLRLVELPCPAQLCLLLLEHVIQLHLLL